MLTGLSFETAQPPLAAAPNRADVACFIGMVARRPGVPLPVTSLIADLHRMLVAAGLGEAGALGHRVQRGPRAEEGDQQQAHRSSRLGSRLSSLSVIRSAASAPTRPRRSRQGRSGVKRTL